MLIWWFIRPKMIAFIREKTNNQIICHFFPSLSILTFQNLHAKSRLLPKSEASLCTSFHGFELGCFSCQEYTEEMSINSTVELLKRSHPRLFKSIFSMGLHSKAMKLFILILQVRKLKLNKISITQSISSSSDLGQPGITLCNFKTPSPVTCGMEMPVNNVNNLVNSLQTTGAIHIFSSAILHDCLCL